MSGTCSWFLRTLVAVAALVAPALSGVGPAAAATSRVRVGSAAELPMHAQTLGALPAADKLDLTIALQPRDASDLSSIATAVSTPGSPLYRHYMSVAQFAQRFGASDQQVAAVKSALRAEGLHIGTVEANHLTISISGTAAEVEKAFSTPLSQVTLSSGRVAYANTSAPMLAPSVARDVRAVVGLDDLTLMKPAGPIRTRSNALGGSATATHRDIATGGPQPCAQATAQYSGGFAYTADYIASMYDFSGLYEAGDLGAGQTVAIFELEGNFRSDITAFKSCYGTNTSVTYSEVDGGPPPPSVSEDDGLETELDIENVGSLAPDAKIIVYQAPNNTLANGVDVYSAIMSQDLAKVVSSSWGACEPDSDRTDVQAESSLFEEAAVQGQSVFVASGDSGSAACAPDGPSDSELAVGDPSSQPFVTGVGGTAVYNPVGASVGTRPHLWAPGDTLDEAVWNDGPDGFGDGPAASTGGISTFWPMPSYQSGAAATLDVGDGGSGTPCGSAPSLCREVPDVSANADPLTGYAVDYDGSWTSVGGTSAAAPLWAAFTALANASSTCRGLTLGFENPALYQIAGTSAYAMDFRDITLANPFTDEANNDALGTNHGLYPVKTGYSMATGLGAPIAPALASSLCTPRLPHNTVSFSSPGAQTTTVGQGVALSVSATDSGGARLTYSATGLPAGLSINSGTGAITGTPTTVQTTTVTVSASDPYTNAGSTQFAWRIINPPPGTIVNPKPVIHVGKPVIESVKLSGLVKRKPTLSFTANAGSNAPSLKTVSISLPKGFSFANKTNTLDNGIGVKNQGKRVRFSVSVHRGVLTISFKSAVRSASVTIGKPAVTISSAEAGKIDHKQIKQLTVNIKTIDTAKTAVKFGITLKKLG